MPLLVSLFKHLPIAMHFLGVGHPGQVFITISLYKPYHQQTYTEDPF